jgi:hypothetical protein
VGDREMNQERGAAPPDDHEDDPALGTLLIRTWYEPGHPQRLRARITYGQTPGIALRTVATTDPDEILRVVQEWLAAQPGIAGRI